jgi:predicted RNA-binding Zn-ribbon protein involved in translation (DUF1610 family)
MAHPITECHKVKAIVVGSGEGTNHYECPTCGESVNIDGSLPKRLSAFEYCLLTATLFMSQVPCDSSYDRKMAELLSEVKKAHDQELVEELENLSVNLADNMALAVAVRLKELKQRSKK